MMIRIAPILIALILSACGSNAKFGDKATCEPLFQAFDQKIAALKVGTSTQSDIQTTLGSPSEKYTTNLSATASYDEYRYRITTSDGSFCGQYRMLATTKLESVQAYKDFNVP